jgi:hypothetical protein
MKLKFLKFVLPILLVLPSLVSASIWNYWRTPSGIDITSPVTLHFDWSDWTEDICDGYELCNYAEYWGLLLLTLDDYYWGELHPRTITETTESFYLPVGTQITTVAVVYVWSTGNWGYSRILEEADPYTFQIIETSTPPTPPSGTIGNTQNWLSQNEILAYIGKLAGDIPNYIALMIGLPIAFWFIEKIIAFVRGNFRSAEKIKKE